MESTHTEQPMSGTAGGNVPPWFASGEERDLAGRWALSSAVATLNVWWFREQGFELLLLLFLYQLFLAIRSYAVTGRRGFLAIGAIPLLFALAAVAPHETVLLPLSVVAVLVWPVLGLCALGALVNPQRHGRQQREFEIAASVAGVVLYAKSVFMLSPDSFRTLDGAEVSGCYRLVRGVSFPLMEHPLPVLVKLDTVRWTVADSAATRRTAVFVAGDHRASPALPGLTGHWRPEARGLVLVGWTARRRWGFRGLFRRDGRDLVGRLVQYQDHHGAFPLPVSSVRLKRAECPAGVSGDLPEPRRTVVGQSTRR
ncbi:MAG: hypothetical protein IPK85_22285 [Gemmatimonadetes bacterium]|nr:hypothetical protein [Gemmatimonadota bacterium]